MNRDIRLLDGVDLVRKLHELGLYPVSCHAAFIKDGTAYCTCAHGAQCPMPGKHPVGDGWQRQSREEALHRLTQFSDWNIGQVTGSISQSVILDVDDGSRQLGSGREVVKTGYASLHVLEKRLGGLPPTISWFTGSGSGQQRLFRIPPGVVMPRNSAGRLGAGLDIRGEGGFGVLPPSNHKSGGRYCWRGGLAPGEVDLAPLPPAWLDAILALAPEPRAPSSAAPRHRSLSILANGDRERAVRRARAYVGEMGPAISGQGGHDLTMSVACRVVERVLDEDDAWAVLQEWNESCEPPWSERELRHKLDDALRKHELGELHGCPPSPRRAAKPCVNFNLLSRLFEASR